MFLSHKGSLTRWREQNILRREIALYAHYLEHDYFDRIALFSYDAADHTIIRELQKLYPSLARLDLLTPRRGACGLGYGLLGPLRHRDALKKMTYLKTNQISGSWTAVIARLITRRLLLHRQGYVLSRRLKLNGRGGAAAVAHALETLIHRQSDAIATTSEASALELRDNLRLPGKVHLLPSYVDLSIYSKVSALRFNEPVLFVGRLEPQKNILNLAAACRAANLPLDIVGRGSLEPELRALSADQGTPIRLLGALPAEKVALLFPKYSVFALPSLHEGLPKALMEAMASGLVCVGANIPGITDLIGHDRTGYLIEDGSVAAIAAALVRAFEERRTDIGAAARQHVERYGLANYAAAEADIFAQLDVDVR